MCGSDQSITFKPYGIPIQTLAVKPNRNWTNLIPAQIESNEGKIISVCFDVSEFRKGQVEFENENTGDGHIELCNSVRENVRSILDESFGGAACWLGQFKHGDESLNECTLHRLMEIREELQKTRSSDPELELALATFIMIEYDDQENTSNSVTALHMSMLMEKLEPFALSALEKLVADIVADLTHQDDTTIMIESIQSYLKARNKSLKITNDVSAVVQHLPHFPSGFVRKAERLDAFARNLLLVFNGLRRSSSLALTTSDIFSLPERISAAITACAVMQKISISSHRQRVLNVQDAVWQLMRLRAGIEVIFFCVTVVQSSTREAPSIYVVEWLASTTDLSRRIQRDPIKQLLKHSFQGASPEPMIVLLSAINAPDFNHGASATNQRPLRFGNIYPRKLACIRKAVEMAQPHALFLHVSDPHASRFIASSVMTPTPANGLCMSKDIAMENACVLLSAQAIAADADLPFAYFERSVSLYTAQSLNSIEMKPGDATNQDKLQASFDAFSWFSSTHGPNKHVGNICENRKREWSQRQVLIEGTPENVKALAELVSKGKRLGHADVLAFHSATGRTGRISSQNGSNYSDDSGTDTPPASANHLHDECSMDNLIGGMSQQLSIMQILQGAAVTRSVQINMEKEDVDAVTYMLLLPDVDGSGRVLRRPVVMHIEEHKTMGHFIKCTCRAFSERARVVQKEYVNSREVWFVQAKYSKQIMFSAEQVKDFCQHASVRDPRVWSTFKEQARYKWNHGSGTKCSVTLDDTGGLWNQTSITVTAGLQVVGRPQHSEVISIKFTGGQYNGSVNMFYSVLTEFESEEVRGHAIVKHSRALLRMDGRQQPTEQMQLFCEECNSRLIQCRGRGHVCVHIRMVSRSIKGSANRAGDRRGADQAKPKAAKHFRVIYNPDLVKPDCSNAEKRTGFDVLNGTYTKEQHNMDFVWKDNQLLFGHENCFKMANEKNSVLQGLQIRGEGGRNPYYSVGKDKIIQGELPAICPRCNTERASIASLKIMPITLYMSDLAVVRTEIEYYICRNKACKHCVHSSGLSDGFWFITKSVGISVMLIWDYITLQNEAHARDMAGYHRHCQLLLAARMRSASATLFAPQRFVETYFVFLSCLNISFNNGCYGCTLDSLDRDQVPEITKHSHAQDLANMAPVGARDISAVGVDGLSRMFADTLDIDKEDTLPDDAADGHNNKETIKGTSDPKSSVLGSCKCCKKNTNFASRQFDRSPIKKHECGSQADAASLRKQLHDLGSLIKSSRVSNLYAIQDEPTNPITTAIKQIEDLIFKEDSRHGSLILIVGLAKVCAQPNVLCMHFGLHKTKLLLRYTGEFLGQLGGSNSVLTLLKPWAIRDSLALCDAFQSAHRDQSVIVACHKKLKSICQTRLATPGPLAASLTTLLDFVEYDEVSCHKKLQQEVNMAILNALRFVAQRTEEVMVFHKVHNRPLSECTQEEIEDVRAKGFKFPVPVRFPGRDINKEFTDEELDIKSPSRPSNPVKDGGAYYFTKTGGCVRDPLECEGEGESGDCKKPGYQHDSRAGRFANKLMAVFMYCACHGEYMGYHSTRNEGRKDPWNVLYRLKPTFPHNISYDYCCG